MISKKSINIFSIFCAIVFFILASIVSYLIDGKLGKLINYGSLILSYLFFISFFLTLSMDFYTGKKSEDEFPKKAVILFCIVVSAVVLLFCSECSFIYPLNLWDDSNCFFTVGKSVLSGKVLYRDLFEQKGPYLYFFHTLAALISKDSFIGVYFIEIILSSILLFYIYKILLLFTSKNVLFLLPILLALMYSSNNFQLGDSAEEFCLTFTIIPFYYSIKNIKQNLNFSVKELIVTGICAGIVFFIKFSMVGFFVGFAIMPVVIYIQKKQFKEIFYAIIYILLGLVISCIPLIIYCLITHSFADFFEVYIFNNIFVYSDENVKQTNILMKFISLVYNCCESLFNHFRNNFIIFVFAALSVIYVFKSFKLQEKLNYFFLYLMTVLFIFGPGRNYRYYSLILDIFIIFSLIPINEWSQKKGLLSMKKLYCTLIGIISLLVIIFIPFHKDVRFVKKDNVPQYKFAKEISKLENPSLLNYGSLDDGFYITANIVPQTKYFCLLNIPIQEMHDEQKRIVADGEVDFVVSRQILDFADKYELIMHENSIRPTWEDTVFYLYKRK